VAGPVVMEDAAVVRADTLGSIAYLQGLCERDLQRLAERCTEQRFERGRLVLQEGAPCPGLSFLVQGRVKIFRVSAEGREQILRVIGPGETFNEVPAFDGGPNPASVQAMEDAVIGTVPADELDRLIREHPRVARHLLRLFAARLRGFVELVTELSLYSVESRVARLLLVSSEQAPELAGLRITQQDMAAMVGTTREVAARALRVLETRGAIRRTDGHITICNRALLSSLSEGPPRGA
jgi:CRP-like cAMP-binding protein